MITDESWKTRASCRRLDGFTEWEVLEQFRVCASCPVRAQCRVFGEQYGAGGVVYGGRQFNRHHAPGAHSTGAKAAA